jgi:hypothetical protein
MAKKQGKATKKRNVVVEANGEAHINASFVEVRKTLLTQHRWLLRIVVTKRQNMALRKLRFM